MRGEGGEGGMADPINGDAASERVSLRIRSASIGLAIAPRVARRGPMYPVRFRGRLWKLRTCSACLQCLYESQQAVTDYLGQYGGKSTQEERGTDAMFGSNPRTSELELLTRPTCIAEYERQTQANNAT